MYHEIRLLVLYSFYQTSLLVCFRGFVCFKLLRKAALSCRVYASQHWKPCHWFISPKIKVTLTCITQSHSFLAPTVQAACQLYCCIVDARCNLYCVLSFVGVRLYLWIFLSIGSIALYICMCRFFLCQSVHLNYIVHMQMIWTLCFRIYGLFCTWWLICTPTSPALPSIHILVILCYDVDISNEGTCFNATSIIWT